MRNGLMAVCGSAIALIGIGAVGAQTPELPKPGPEVQKLGAAVGTWHQEMDGHPFTAPDGRKIPARKSESTERCDWFEGGFQLVCREEVTGPRGKMNDMSILAYDLRKHAYTSYAFNSFGQSTFNTFTVSGETWTWVNENTVNGKSARSRITFVFESPRAHSRKEELSVDGGPWVVTGEGKRTRVDPGAK